jgi:hypothetical protein
MEKTTKGFRKISEPNTYASYSKVNVDQKQYVKTQFPEAADFTPDNRYHEWPAIMSDGRLGTDYYDHCSKNIPVGRQYPTKQWLQNNATQIIDYTRNHSLPITRSLDKSVIPPPAQILKTTKYNCFLENTYSTYGIGVERDNNTTPDLFGTFSQQKFEDKSQNDMTTQRYEGGRNTPRGTYQNLNVIYHLKKKDDY